MMRWPLRIFIKRIFESLLCNASIPVAKPPAALGREEEERKLTDGWGSAVSRSKESYCRLQKKINRPIFIERPWLKEDCRRSERPNSQEPSDSNWTVMRSSVP